jgi:large conductance mechanosensitive channel
MLEEFKKFALKGNLVDMAVAFVMGGAFGKVVSSFIEGVFMPPVSLLWGGDLEGSIVLRDGIAAVTDATGAVLTPEVAEVSIKYGAFVSALISFIIVAFVMFMLVKGINSSKKPEAPAPPKGPTTEELLMEIRDALKK